jgi:hypothetical protein
VAVAYDPAGYAALAGSFDAAFTFCASALANAGGLDAFVAKASTVLPGTCAWAVAFGGATGDEQGAAVAVDPFGNVALGGQFSSASLTVGAATLANAGSTDIFVALLGAAAGRPSGQRPLAAPARTSLSGVALDSAQNVVILGGSLGGGLTVGPATCASAGPFVAKLAAATGAVLWATCLPTGTYCGGGGVAVGPGDAVVITGLLLGRAHGRRHHSWPARAARTPTWLRFTSAGAAAWATSLGSTANDAGASVALDASGQVLVTGSFQGTLALGLLRPSPPWARRTPL